MLQVPGEVQDEGTGHIGDAGHLLPWPALVGIGLDLPAKCPKVSVRMAATDCTSMEELSVQPRGWSSDDPALKGQELVNGGDRRGIRCLEAQLPAARRDVSAA